MNPQIIRELKDIIKSESSWVPVMANAAALIFSADEKVLWAGFYLLDSVPGEDTARLLLGPFQGAPAVSRIPVGAGIVGEAVFHDRPVYRADAESLSGDPAFVKGAASGTAVPLHNSAGEVIGAMCVLCRRRDALEAEERDRISEMAMTVEIGISGLEEPGYVNYRMALRSLREPVRQPVVVYQGEPGAYSEAAAQDFFGESAEITGLRVFEDTFKALKNGTADYAVLPIENSSTGVIRQVYDLLAKYECYMIGETTVRIQHSFMVLPGTKLEQIEAVYSHEQGLFQCEEFLSAHPEWKQIPQEDTAGSARIIAEKKDPTRAAICSPWAADLYGLEILFQEVNSDSRNTTRFVVIAPDMEIRDGSDKICISFMTPHKPGALHEVLTIFTVRGLNLMRLESRPIPEHNWEYMFFVEFTGNLDSPGMDDVIRELADTTDNLRVYGNFRSNL